MIESKIINFKIIHKSEIYTEADRQTLDRQTDRQTLDKHTDRQTLDFQLITCFIGTLTRWVNTTIAETPNLLMPHPRGAIMGKVRILDGNIVTSATVIV